MTKYVECWGADKPFANITDSKMAKNIGLAVQFFFTKFKKMSFKQKLLLVEYRNDRIEFITTGT